MLDFDGVLTLLNTKQGKPDKQVLTDVLAVTNAQLQKETNVLYYGIDLSGAFAVQQLVTRVLRRNNMVKPVAYLRKQILMWQAEQNLPEMLRQYAERELLKQFRQYRVSRKHIIKQLKTKTTFGELTDSYRVHTSPDILTVYNISPISWYDECYKYDNSDELISDKDSRWTMFSRWVQYKYGIPTDITLNPADWRNITSVDISFTSTEDMYKFIYLVMKGGS